MCTGPHLGAHDRFKSGYQASYQRSRTSHRQQSYACRGGWGWSVVLRRVKGPAKEHIAKNFCAEVGAIPFDRICRINERTSNIGPKCSSGRGASLCDLGLTGVLVGLLPRFRRSPSPRRGCSGQGLWPFRKKSDISLTS